MVKGTGHSLSPKQRECLLLVSEGLTTKEIAFELGLSPRTVDEHIEKGRAKLGAPNRQRAAAAVRRELANIADQAHPYPLRGESLTVAIEQHFAPSISPTSRLEDGEKVRFEHFAPTQEPEIPASGEGNDGNSVDRLRILLKILIIAASLALILLAMPSLIVGAEAIASFILMTINTN